MPGIAPAEPPYEPQIATALERIMPPGVPPLVLFRTMAEGRASSPMLPAAFWTKARQPGPARE